jgi:RHS repeat-associated protein
VVASYPTSTGAPVKNLYHSADGDVVEERWGSDPVGSAVKYQYVWSPAGVNTLVLRDEYASGALSQRLYVEQDANGNVTSLTNTSGTAAARFVYDPYGNVTFLNAAGTAPATPVSWDYTFQGGRRDQVAGRVSFGARDYVPFEGRWAQRDPLGLAAGNNVYQFVGGNPVAYTDPTGLYKEAPGSGAPKPTSKPPTSSWWDSATSYAASAFLSVTDFGAGDWFDRNYGGGQYGEQDGLATAIGALSDVGGMFPGPQSEIKDYGEAFTGMDSYGNPLSPWERGLAAVPVIPAGWLKKGKKAYDAADDLADTGRRLRKLDEVDDFVPIGIRDRGRNLAQKQGRQFDKDQLPLYEFDPNQPKHVRGWLENERRRIAGTGGGPNNPRNPPGYVQAHGRTTPAREGYDYSNSRLQGIDLNKLEERIRRRRGYR